MTHIEYLYIRQYYGHFEMINIRLVQQQFCRSIINSSNDICASRSSLHFTNLVCIKCITVLYQPHCFIDIRPLRNFDPHINTTDGCVSLYSSFYYSTIVPCELHAVSLNVLLMANVWRLLKVLGYSVIVLGPKKKKNKLLKLSWEGHISNSWMN